ncbi:mitochondrial arginine transporter BAC2-like [Arachis stenosperma]|uniref:mitochondrial arginine transporter BAC2-like n=1 Tax=Arachis stenosperma TaxID=217475 RepID=UPI0025ACAB15|nr:mitochondrial arginine transporter BAC2-like [Arachis stenosperma]
MDLWAEFHAASWGREFVAGGFGGIAGIVSGHPLDTVRIRQQVLNTGGHGSSSAFTILRNALAKEGPASLYRGMGAPLASVTFQNAMVFQTNAILSRVFGKSVSPNDPPSFKGVALGGVGTGVLQSLIISPIELVKIRLQLHRNEKHLIEQPHKGPIIVVKNVWRKEGLKGIYRGLGITVIRDGPSHGVYFWTYEYMKEQLHPGCRKSGQESLCTMLMAGGLAGVASWIVCYPFDVAKTKLQAQTPDSLKYNGTVDCLRKSIKEEGYGILWRGLGTTVARAFVVHGVVFTAYEITLRLLFNNEIIQVQKTI